MKLKLFIAVAATSFFAACSTTYRATDTGVVISTDAQRAFDLQYPNSTNIIWTSYDPNVVINDWELADWEVMNAEDYAVQFDMNGRTYYAWYDQAGNWTGTVEVINDFSTLPAYVSNTITTKYPSYVITGVNQEFQINKTNYEVVIKKGDEKMVLLMDANGNILKSKYKS